MKYILQSLSYTVNSLETFT